MRTRTLARVVCAILGLGILAACGPGLGPGTTEPEGCLLTSCAPGVYYGDPFPPQDD
jgi:hypothetical protein